LSEAEIGVAAHESLPAVVSIADDQVSQPGGAGVASYIHKILQCRAMVPTPRRRAVLLGKTDDGFSVTLPDSATRVWLAVPWIAAIVHFLLLPIPLASLRTTLMIHSVLPGLIAYQMLWRRGGPLLLAVLNVLFAYKIVTFVAAGQSGNLLSTAAMLSRFLS